MECPKCNTENREGRQFLLELRCKARVCVRIVGFANDPGDKFCGGCGADLAAAETGSIKDQAGPMRPAPSAGQRRQVTIFFADLSGYTELSEALDAEDLHTLVGRVLDAIDRLVESHGGTVHRHVGDEVMALFGAPVAYGEDPLRALRTALATHRVMVDLSAELGRDLAVHIGIASGEVVVAGQGQELPEDIPDYAVTGVAANLASRLKSLADSGETIISDAVRQATERYVECELLREVQVKGLERPVRVWRAKSLRPEGARLGRDAFVGRRVELAQFRGVLESCKETGTGQSTVLRGEAGIEKSRLVEEFESMARDSGFACHKSLALDFGVGTGQDTIRALVRSLLGVSAGSGPATCAEAADKALADGLYDVDQRIFLNDLLDLPQPDDLQTLYEAMDNSTRNLGKRSTVTKLIAVLSLDRPLSVTIEDIHRADSFTLSHLAEIAATVQNARSVLLMTSRVEGDPLDQAWRGATRGSPLMTIDLGPLRKQESIELAGGFADVTDDFAQACIDRAQGNPLFLEQLLRSVQESGSEEVPVSIQSLMLARIDRLPEADQEALGAASTIGQRFALPALQHVMQAPTYSCRILIEHHLVREEAEGEGYIFAHALIQEGVYSSLLKSQRRELHRRAADWFKGHDAALHAEHLDRAEDGTAPLAYLAAAERTLSANRYDRALGQVTRGLELATVTADKRALTFLHGQMLLDLGMAAQAIEAYRNALELADNDGERCRAWIGLAAGMRVTDDYNRALEALERGQALARGHDFKLELVFRLFQMIPTFRRESLDTAWFTRNLLNGTEH